MEISKHTRHNPIVQDLDGDQLRTYTYGDILCNYGALPQSWEDPKQLCPHTNTLGDGDPLDLVEIGVAQLPMGSISPVRVVGALGMIDGNETDWKIVGVRTDDVLAENVHDIVDVERAIPGLLKSLRVWFANYKKGTGQDVRFAFDGEYQNREFALNIVRECHASWRSTYAQDGT